MHSKSAPGRKTEQHVYMQFFHSSREEQLPLEDHTGKSNEPVAVTHCLETVLRFSKGPVWRSLGRIAQLSLTVPSRLLLFGRKELYLQNILPSVFQNARLVPPLLYVWQAGCQTDFFDLAAAHLLMLKVSPISHMSRTCCCTHNVPSLLMLISSSDVIHYHIH